MVFNLRKRDIAETLESRAHRLTLITDLTFELVPLKSLDAAVEALPAGAEVSVTASPAKGLDETMAISERLVAQGFSVIPHISARMVRDQDHVTEIAAWFRSSGLAKMFLVGGDTEDPGEFSAAADFLAALLERDHGLDTIGVTAYPDGHALISDELLRDALLEKQQLLADAGVAGYASTQMCFNPTTISRWLEAERSRGMDLPIHLGLPGVVDKAKLMSMGVRLGIGQSLSYLKKNRAAVAKIMTMTSYDPNDLLVPLSADLLELGVEGLHMFTFNNVEATNQWRLSAIEH
ncbi:MAG: methylenetetrahydrofolate reductase [Acidimicrobiales bacterium]